MRILIGYNGSDAAKAALEDLKNAGFPDKTEAIVFTVAEAWLPPTTPDDAFAIAAAGKSAVESYFPTWTVTADTASGSPPREILVRAESFKPDLIVVGEPRPLIGEHNMFIGHTSQIILTEAGCSVRIARGNGRGGINTSAAKILVGFDGSPGAMHAIDLIAMRVWPSNTQVRLVAVADSSVLGTIGRFTPQMKDATVEAKFAAQWAETLAATSLEKLKNAGIPSSIQVRFGHPKFQIIEEAETWEADAVFVGPHCAPNSFERFLIGSVSIAVASQASCSVEVVRK